MRRPKSHNAKSGRGHILDMVSIRERPAEIEDRAVPGRWEGSCFTNRLKVPVVATEADTPAPDSIASTAACLLTACVRCMPQGA